MFCKSRRGNERGQLHNKNTKITKMVLHSEIAKATKTEPAYWSMSVFAAFVALPCKISHLRLLL
jgi:hypothetical protein